MSARSANSYDPQVAALIQKEGQRQQLTLCLIASENHSSRIVREALASRFTDKYAEGYPGRRYYAGCQVVDEAESLAIARAQELFGAEHANVQPHSGVQANMAAYFALLQPGDMVLSMTLTHGGHLSHGSPASFSGRLYRFVHYGVNRETELLDYEEVARQAERHRPKLIVAGTSSYPRQIDFQRLREIGDGVGAKLMVDIAHLGGLVAGGVHPSPVPFAQVVTGTTHKTLRGPRGGFILSSQGEAQAIDAAVFPGIQGGPHAHTILAKAVAFGQAQKPEFAQYQRRVVENARTLAARLQDLGFSLVSGGTDTHLLTIKLTPLNLTGLEAETALAEVGLVANRNAIPYDPNPPSRASGLRLGTPAITTRGMGVGEVEEVARLIHRLLTHLGEERVKREVSQRVRELCQRFPIPEE